MGESTMSDRPSGDDAGTVPCARCGETFATVWMTPAQAERSAASYAGRPGATRCTPAYTYDTARERYMESGTIACKEAMLEFVTMTEPDLLALVSRWEPKPTRAPTVRPPCAHLGNLPSAAATRPLRWLR